MVLSTSFFRLIILTALLSTGCRNFVSGVSLVVIKPDDDVKRWRNGLGNVYVYKAIHYWDTAGARFRTLDELSAPEEEFELPNADTLEIKIGDLSSSRAGFCQWYPGLYIEANVQFWETSDDDNENIEILAHEIGHAMLLEHVTDHKAVMYHSVNGVTSIDDSDIIEYNKYW